jgi:DNA-binding transcriptional MocR family regulator
MELEGIAATPDDVVVTVGSQQALDIVTRTFCDPGDVVVAEGPSYVGALGTFASYQTEVVHVPMDEDGLVPEALRETLARLERAGRRPKLIYTVPNYHNPAGVSLAEGRRDEIVEIAARAGVLLLEDDPYGLLGFDEEPRRALRARETSAAGGGNVLYLGSFSKTFAPGLRVGWVLAPPEVRQRLVLASEAAVLCPPMFNQLVVAEYLATQPWQQQVKVFRDLYRERRDATLDALETLMPPGCRWTHPTGGFYVWLTLPPGLDSKAMAPRAIEARVAYVPGTGFFADGTGAAHLRLSYCYPEPARIREGIRRLAGVVEQETELRIRYGPVTGEDHTAVTHPADVPGPEQV